MGRKRTELTMDDLINWWLRKYHNTSITELAEKEPELVKTSAWYEKYAVTAEQHDEWYEWAIDSLSKQNKWSKKRTKSEFAFPYLNAAPSTKEDSILNDEHFHNQYY
jgi:hypothetical protein